jgi:hypothetical protein
VECAQAYNIAQSIQFDRVVQMLIDVVARLRQHVRLGVHLSRRAALARPVASALGEFSCSKEFY